MSGKLFFLVVAMVVLVSVSSSPIKEKDIDDIIFMLSEMKSEIHLDARNLDELGGGYLLKKKDSYNIPHGGHYVRNLDSLGAANNGSSDRHHYNVHNSEDNGEEITDSDRNRLLYDYLVSPIGRFYGKRDFDEIDRFGFSKRMSRRPAAGGHKRNLDEIDRYGFSNLKRNA